MPANTFRPTGSVLGYAHSLRMVFSRLAGIRPLGTTPGVAAPRIPGSAWALVAAIGTIMVGAAARGQEHDRTGSLRLLTGSDVQLRDSIERDSIAGGGCIKFELVPVNPYPGGGSYPAGTVLGPNSITLPGCGQCVWLETRISNWACAGTMQTWQASIGPDSVLPAGIQKCDRACASGAACTAVGFGPGTGAGVAGPSRASATRCSCSRRLSSRRR